MKINTVIVRDVNENQIVTLAELTSSRPLQLRFIERMPPRPGRGEDGKQEGFVACDEVVEVLRRNFPLREIEVGTGLSRRFLIDGHAGEIGLIAPLSRSFCRSCNRLRLTADGQLRPCLLDNVEVNLKEALRNRASTEELVQLIQQAVAIKKERHHLNDKLSPVTRPMCQIGG